jgi:mRNA interferase RelE/StbE
MANISLSYSVSFARSARKELESLDTTIALRILRKIESLPEDPRPAGCKKLAGQKSLWRIRIGDFRIVYSIDDINRFIDVSIIRHRSSVYNSLD